MTSTAEKIKERLDIVEVIGSYIKLTKAGRNFKARCPFHNEKTPSFSVSSERQFFYCFGCQAKGDMFSFVEKFEGLDFKGALRMLADRAGIKLEEYDPNSEEKDKEAERLYKIIERSMEIFKENLKGEEKVKEYLEKRGISEDSAVLWKIGFAPLDWRRLHDKLIEEGFTLQEILKTGMIKESEGPSNTSGQVKYYDTFRGRVMFPIFDASGRPVAFSGRILVSDDKSPKYLNSPETSLFHKSEILYGLNFAKSEIRRLDYSVLVEGQMDLVMSHQAGVKNTVASSGTALSEIHLRRLQKISNRIILAYDSDEAGLKAARRSSELALSLGMDVKIVAMPEDEDPASVVQASPEKWKEYLKEAKSVVEFLLDKAIKKAKAGLPLAKEVNLSVIPFVGLVQNEILRSEYCNLISRKTGISQNAIEMEVSKQVQNKTPSSEVEIQDNSPSKFAFTPEEIILGIALSEKEKKEEIMERLSSVIGREALKEILEKVEKEKDILLFEMEERFGNLDLNKVLEEKMQIIEKNMLKEKFVSLGMDLDKAAVEEKEKVKKEMKEVGERLAKMSS